MIFIGSDHAGFRLKQALKRLLESRGEEVSDLGAPSEDSVDYPPIAREVARRVAESGGRDRGLLVCGSGIGMSIAANREPGVRAALCEDAERARLSRAHNDANVLVLAGRFLDEAMAEKVLDAFLQTEFEGGRHQNRVAQIDAGKDPS